MTDINSIKQTEISGFFYKKDNLADTPVSLFTFGENIVESLGKSKGSLNPVYASNPKRVGTIDIIDQVRGAPELGELTFRERVHRSALNFMEQRFKQDCSGIFLFKFDNCGERDDLGSWQSVIVVDSGRISNIAIESPQSFDANNPVEMTGTFNHLNWERILPIRFGEVAADEILAEALAVIYYDDRSCGTCSAYSEGCDKSAVLATANTGSPGLSSQLVWTTDHWVTPTIADITPLGGAAGTDLVGVGTYFMVTYEFGHAYAPKSNPIAANWVDVQTGYSGAAPRAIYAKSVSEVFVTATNGYIFKSVDITSGVSTITDGSITTEIGNAIHGNGQVIVSVHDNNVVLYSTNNGDSFTALTTSLGTTGPEASADLRAVWVVSPYQWYIGTSTGKLWYTMDQGATWTQRNLPGQSTLSEVLDIQFSSVLGEVGAIAVQTTFPVTGLVYRTVTGGRTWQSTAPGISALPANERINSIALCDVNEIAVGGLQTGSTDGIVAVAQ